MSHPDPSADLENLKEEDNYDVCEFCGGTGKVSCDEDDGEGNVQRGVGIRKCICQIKQ